VRQLESQAAALREQSGQLRRQAIQASLERSLDGPESDIDLFHAALWVAKVDQPDLDVEAYRQRFDEMTAELQALLPEKPPADNEQRLDALTRYMFQENGFHGSRSEYYHHANSQVNRVLDDREGLPLTLAILFLEWARRIGLDSVAGVSLPGHFVVRHLPADGGGDAVYLDVFDGARRLSEEDLGRVVLNHAQTVLRTEYLRPATKREILVRMLRNLSGAAQKEDQYALQLRYLDLLLAVNPESGPDRFLRAGSRLQNRDVDGAKADLRWILDRQPEGVDLSVVAEILRAL
jgi:regulator of sirC expression with transglutaminase-like and TPR domain